MSELKVDKITPRLGTTLTLGDSGDTINFGSGVLPNFENLTVTGDLTVDTNSLKVDSTNNFVGIGTATPSSALDIVGNIVVSGTVDGRDIATDGTKLDTIATNATANPNAIDNVVEDTTPQLGGNLDLNSNNITGTGNINITGTVAATSYTGDGSSLTGINTDLVSDTTPQLGGDLASNGHDILMADNDKAVFGAGSDLQIYHDGTNSYIDDTGTGNLYIRSSDRIQFYNSSGTEVLANFDAGGACRLFYDNSLKLATKSDGVDITGELQCDSLDVDGGGNISGTLTMGGNIDLQDNDKILLGSSDDLEIYHDGSNSIIKDNGTGFLSIQSNGSLIALSATAGENYALFRNNGAVELYYDNVKKFETTSAGATVNGALTTTSIITPSSGTSSFHTVDLSGEFNMIATGSNIMDFNGTAVVARWLGSSPAFEEIFRATRDAEISLKYNGSTKLQTTSSGVTVTGTLTETSSIEYKENVQPLEFNEAIYNVNAVKYDRKDGSQKDEVGVIAEDLYEILPDLVECKDGKPESVKYTKLTMYLLEALKKQNEEIKMLKEKLN